uniref:Pyridoxal phosphate phosphatase n=1 Tax=Hirondellea gigas TaxID=1518452 RepID=A0A6A7G7J0_9CRUS
MSKPSVSPRVRAQTHQPLSHIERFKLVGGSFTSGMKRKVPSKSKLLQANLSEYRAFLLDMDGVLHRHHEPIHGARKFLSMLKNNDIPYLLLTNEDRHTNEDLSNKLHEIFGDACPTPDHIYSAANSSRDFFARLIRHGFNGSVYVIGEAGLIQNLKEAYMKNGHPSAGNVLTGLEELPKDSSIEYVVIGCVHAENTRHVERAADFVRQGARLVHTCPDYYDTYPDGRYSFGMPMTTVHLFEETLGCTSYNLGKPNPHMIRMAQDLLLKGTTLQWKDVLFVGDSINTDIRTSIENGIDCALVLSGCTTEEQLKRSPLYPNYVFEDIGELSKAYKFFD